jgi:hypothetical protein
MSAVHPILEPSSNEELAIVLRPKSWTWQLYLRGNATLLKPEVNELMSDLAG